MGEFIDESPYGSPAGRAKEAAEDRPAKAAKEGP